jgi:hypothetical protein
VHRAYASEVSAEQVRLGDASEVSAEQVRSGDTPGAARLVVDKLMTMRLAGVGLVLIGLVAPAAAEDSDEVKAIRTSGLVLTDGKNHYFAFPVAEHPKTWPDSEPDVNQIYYFGDGKTFHKVAVSSYESSAFKHSRSWQNIDRRFARGSRLTFLDGEYAMECGAKTTRLTAVAPVSARKLVSKAAFVPPRPWRREVALGRDGTTYYYVDKAQFDDESDYRLYIGKRGAMKLQKLVGSAVDTGGIVLSTKAGSARIVFAPAFTITWETKTKTVDLVEISIEENLALIYDGLGVHTGKRFGVPCDDLF